MFYQINKLIMLIFCIFFSELYAGSCLSNLKKYIEALIDEPDCYLDKLPQPIKAQLALECYKNDLKERNERKRAYYWSDNQLYKHEGAWHGRLAYDAEFFHNKREFFLVGWKKPEEVKIILLSSQGEDIHDELIIDYNESYEKYGRHKPHEKIAGKTLPDFFVRNVVLCTISRDKNKLFTLEYAYNRSHNSCNNLYDLVLRERKVVNSLWQKTFIKEVQCTGRPDEIMYFEEFDEVGLLTSHNMVIVRLDNNRFDYNEPFFDSYCAKKAIKQNSYKKKENYDE